MFCIAAFIVFAVLAIFSATFRPLAGKAWHCVLRRISFRPCDIDFSEELKGKIVGKIFRYSPRSARFVDRWMEVFSTIFVVLSIWSLVYVLTSGLYLYVYGTCYPASVESCTLSGEACGVDQQQLSLVAAVKEGKIGPWAAGPFVRVWDALSRVPDRLRSWDPARYVPPQASFYKPFDASQKVVVEIVDPGCQFCKKLTGNLLAAGINGRYNLTYLLYPIPVGTSYKFPNSLLMASYIEAAKFVALPRKSALPPDWQLIEKIFSDSGTGVSLQTKFNIGFDAVQAEAELKTLLAEIGYTPNQIKEISDLAHSPKISQMISAERNIVERQVRTIKIPTLLIGARRFDRVVSTETLRTYTGK